MLDYNKYPPRWVDLSEFDGNDRTFQCRKVLRTPEQLKDLADSMADVGQEQPILARNPRSGGQSHIVYGFNRYDAAALNGWQQIYAVIVPENELPDKEARKMSVTNNIQNMKLVDLDLTYICKDFYEVDKMTYVEIGKEIGKSEAQVRRYIKLANAPADLQAKVKAGETTLKDATDNQKRPGDAFSEINKNNYVKSTKNGFHGFIKYSPNSDSPEAVAKHIEDIKSALKQAQKEAAKKLKAAAKKASKNLSSRPQGEILPANNVGEEGVKVPAASSLTSSPLAGEDSGEGGVAAPTTGATGITEAELKEMQAQQQKGFDALKESLKTPEGRAMVEPYAKAQGFNTVEEYITNMEEVIKKQKLG